MENEDVPVLNVRAHLVSLFLHGPGAAPCPRKRGLKTQEKLLMPVQFLIFKFRIAPS